MSAQSTIPLTFNVADPKRLRADLERQASTLEAYHSTLTGPQQKAVLVRKPVARRLNDTTVAFGEFTQLAPNDGQTINAQLARPDPRNAGLRAHIVRRNTLGTVVVSSPGATINGFASVELLSAVGEYAFFFDGENYFTAPGTVWGVP